MNKWIVCAFVTHGTPYIEILSTTLLPSLKQFNIPHHIEAYSSRGKWLLNVALKPFAILNTMTKHPYSNIVCLDADSKVCQYPVLFDSIEDEYDIALYTLKWSEWYKYKNATTTERLSGTVWIRNSEKMREFCSEWYERSQREYMWEQKIMTDILEKRSDIKIFDLPIEYCTIRASLPNGEEPGICVKNAVIEHFQASRTMKKRIR